MIERCEKKNSITCFLILIWLQKQDGFFQVLRSEDHKLAEGVFFGALAVGEVFVEVMGDRVVVFKLDVAHFRAS